MKLEPLVRYMRPEDVAGVVELQKSAFPPPFPQDYHWDPESLLHHIALFPEGQFVAVLDGVVVGSCSNAIIPEENWQARDDWYETVGGPEIEAFDPNGSTLFGLDIAVHPDFRRQGVGGQFYARRFDLVMSKGLIRYGTGCRIPDFAAYRAKNPGAGVHEYARRVVAGEVGDRTLTPLLRYGLRFLGVTEEYMMDVESDNAAAILEWVP